MKHSRHFKTVICVALGAVILTGAAFANFDNANGYTMYKNAVKDMVYAENFSANANLSLEFDGMSMAAMDMEYMFDKNGYTSEYNKESNTEPGYSSASETWLQDGKRITRHSDGMYSSHNTQSTGWTGDMLDDESSRDIADKTIRFVELAADMLVGDLKNNFVLAGNDGGSKTYQVSLRGQQIPEIVNAGLSLMFSSMGAYEDYEPSYVDIDPSFYNELNRSGGENKELSKKINDMYDVGHQELARRGHTGIVYFNKNGEMTYYKTQDEYYAAQDITSSATSEREMMRSLGTDPFIEGANCHITFDSQGRIINNRIDGTLSGYDKDGVKHSYTLKIEYNIFDYGTTKIEPIDIDSLPMQGRDSEVTRSSSFGVIGGADGPTSIVIVPGDEEIVAEEI